jgi:thiamine-phosphate pyrophosphorylase
MEMTSTEKKPRRLDFSDVALYAITPEPKDVNVWLTKIDAMLAGGVDAVQLRSRSLNDRELLQLGAKVKALCVKHGALFLINNRVDLALILNTDGIHIGHEDISIAQVRTLIGHRKIVGMSTHSMPEALEAQKAGADYVSCGPVWATPTKPDYKAVGLGLIGLYNAALKVPYVAIGGIDASNFDQVLENGAKTVAVVRALFDAADPTALAHEFKTKLQFRRHPGNL